MDSNFDQIFDKIIDYSDKIGVWRILIEEKSWDYFVIGYYYNEENKMWEVYRRGRIGNFSKYVNSKEEALNELYKIICIEAEVHEDSYNKLLKIKEKLGIAVNLNRLVSSQFSIGYYFDKENQLWTVYTVDERQNIQFYFAHSSKNEALAELYRLARLKLEEQERHTVLVNRNKT